MAPYVKYVPFAEKACDFLTASPDPFHVVHNSKARLESEGYMQLDTSEPFAGKLKPGGKYYYIVNHTTLIVFAVGGSFDPKTPFGFHVIGGHTDSPNLKVKPRSKRSASGCTMLAVECYGGGLWHTWFDRDLTVAGRVLVRAEDGRVAHKLVYVPRALCRIPTLAIHLTSGDERSTFKPNLESHLPPMLATGVKEALWRDATPVAEAQGSLPAGARHSPLLLQIVASELGCAPEDILDFELQLADVQPSALIGACSEFVSSGRLDNQGTCYMATQGLIESCADGSLASDASIRMISMFDHEEVGSLSAQGAQSTMFEDTVSRVCSALGADLFATKARSFQISSDMAHAVHPNYSDRHDPKNRPRMHGGLVLKHNANQRYSTNAIGATFLRRVAEIANSPIQEFAVKADSPCGTTIGPITAAGTGIRTVDVGPPQLSMHSCRELMGADDVAHAIRVFITAFRRYSELSQAVDVDGPDPFWADPGAGWGKQVVGKC